MDGTTKILVVDDDKMIHGLIGSALKDWPFQLFHAYDGEEGVRYYHAHRPALILLDVDMPVMNGLQVLRHLDVKTNKKCPVIVMSGLASNNEQAQCLELGAQMFMGKPFQITALIKSINHYLSCNRSLIKSVGAPTMGFPIESSRRT